MQVTLFYLAFVTSLANGISNKEQFIMDVLESGHVDMCDFGYVYEHKKIKAANQIVPELNDR